MHSAEAGASGPVWSPYPDHALTLWAMAPSQEPAPSHLDVDAAARGRRRKRLQWWQLSRNYNISAAGAADGRGRTTEVLASHRLNLGRQSVCRLSIPLSAVAHLDGLTELRMPYNKLRALPPALFQIAGLETLNLEYNQLDEAGVPDRLWCGLERLRVLQLAGNRFRQLPPSLGRMPRLFYLDVSDNPRLDCLPGELLVSPTINTLAARHCSPALAQSLRDLAPQAGATGRPTLPLTDLIAGGSGAQHARVPPLAAMCARQLTLAMALPAEPPDGGCDCDGDCGAEALHCVRAACEEMRRRPEEHHPVPDVVARATATDRLCLCSACGQFVHYPSFSFVELAAGWELPAAWRCCSARCRDAILSREPPQRTVAAATSL
ncbi:hypothetical protein H4R18_000598 [Coemansia javaensis]|uniref:Uncharacterized protein n=1 Tax=Coemansia javaensis TaxID=2761396 RepID=A0A9W8HNZ4_9FUNG|nr:hypothetical protein H4R18_000598 [Coemansia javaensis]